MNKRVLIGRRGRLAVWVTLALLSSWTRAAEPGRVRYFPMIAVNDDAETMFLVHNPGKKAILVQVRIWASDASELVSEKVSVAPLETRKLSYPGDSSKAVGGWAMLTSRRPFLATEFLRGGPSQWLGVPEAKPSRRFKVFGMVDLKDGLQTGLALTNPDPARTARVELLLRDKSGKEIRRKSVTLPPRSNTSG